MLEGLHQVILLNQRTIVSDSSIATCYYRAETQEQNSLLLIRESISLILDDKPISKFLADIDVGSGQPSLKSLKATL